MKLPHIHKNDFYKMFAGLLVGVGIGMYIFSFAVPYGNSIYGKRLYEKSNFGDTKKFGDMQRTMHSNNVIRNEIEFLQNMIDHHRDAVGLSAQVLTTSPSDEVKVLANQILVNQTEEIEQMKEYLKNLSK